MARCDSAADLKDWTQYRKFLKERLRALPEEPGPFFLSREKIDFDVEGKPWPGYAILFEKKGVEAVRKLKKEKVLFREGSCTRQNGSLVVEGLAPNLVQHAQKTLAKLKIGLAAVPGPPGGGSGGAPAQPPGADLAATAKKLEARVRPRAERLARLAPEYEPQIRDSLRQAREAQSLRVWSDAVEAWEILDVFLDSVEKELRRSTAQDQKLRAELKRLEKKNRRRAERAAEAAPEYEPQIRESLEDVAKALENGELAPAVEAWEILDVFLDSVEKELGRSTAQDQKLRAELKRLEKKNRRRAERAAKAAPEYEPQIRESLDDVAKALENGELAPAVEAWEILDAFLDSIEKELAEGSPADGEARRTLERLEATEVPRAKRLAGLAPQYRGQIKDSLTELAAAKRAGDTTRAIEALEILSAFLDSIERELAEDEADDARIRRQLDELKTRNVRRAKLLAELLPKEKAAIAASLKEAADAERRGDLKGALGLHEVTSAWFDSLDAELLE